MNDTPAPIDKTPYPLKGSRMTDRQLAELRRLALDADGENWRALDYYDSNAGEAAFKVVTSDPGQESLAIARGASEWNALYIAAANPGIVLSLLDRLDALLDGAEVDPALRGRGRREDSDAPQLLPRALDALEAVLEFATAARAKIRRTYISQPDTAYAGYANAMDDVIHTIKDALRSES